jgi:hypothetical protein
MIRHLRFVCCLVVLGLAGVAQAKPFRVLAFYSLHVEQDHVDFAMQAIPFFQAMARRDHFEFKTTSNWDDMNPTVLKQYQVVMWLDEFPSMPAQRKAFEEYMEHGGGWMGFHIAGWTENRAALPWFADFLGAVFVGNSWPPLPASWQPKSAQSEYQGSDDPCPVEFSAGIQGHSRWRRCPGDLDKYEIQDAVYEHGTRKQDSEQRNAEPVLREGLVVARRTELNMRSAKASASACTVSCSSSSSSSCSS